MKVVVVVVEMQKSNPSKLKANGRKRNRRIVAIVTIERGKYNNNVDKCQCHVTRCELTYSFVCQRATAVCCPFIMRNVCHLLILYILSVVNSETHRLLFLFLSLSLNLFHTFLSVRRSEPYMMIMFLSLSLSRCCSLSALHTSFNHVYLQLLSMDQIHGSHKVHMSDYVSLSGKHTEKNGAKKMTEDGNRLCLPIKNITNCHFCVSNFQRKTQ